MPTCWRLSRLRTDRYDSDFVNLSAYVNQFERFCRCGRCPACATARINAYVVRTWFEFKYATNPSYFVGLSISEDYYRKELRPFLFFERFRDRFRKKYGFFPAYLVSYEYGKRFTKRLHYHLLLLNCPFCITKELLEEIWQYGIVFVGDYFDVRSVLYASKYLGKSWLENKARTVDLFRNVRCSNYYGLAGFDSQLINEVRELLFSGSMLMIGNRCFGVPRFYRLHCLSESERLKLALKDVSEIRRTFLVDGREYSADDPALYLLLKEKFNAFSLSPVSEGFLLYESMLQKKKLVK